MDDEYFTIEVVFTAQETQNNMEKGAIYLESKFTSYKQQQSPVSFHRMGSMQMRNSFFVSLKELIRSLPVIGWLCNCDPSQLIVIPIVENFNNRDFQTSAIELTLSNTSI